MKRIFSTVAVMMMAVLALAICVRQTIEARDVLGENLATPLVAVEVLLIAALLIAVAALVRRSLLSPLPKRPGPVRQSGRRFSTV